MVASEHSAPAASRHRGCSGLAPGPVAGSKRSRPLPAAGAIGRCGDSPRRCQNVAPSLHSLSCDAAGGPATRDGANATGRLPQPRRLHAAGDMSRCGGTERDGCHAACHLPGSGEGAALLSPHLAQRLQRRKYIRSGARPRRTCGRPSQWLLNPALPLPCAGQRCQAHFRHRAQRLFVLPGSRTDRGVPECVSVRRGPAGYPVISALK